MFICCNVRKQNSAPGIATETYQVRTGTPQSDVQLDEGRRSCLKRSGKRGDDENCG